MPPRGILDDIRSVVLLYPYCGHLNGTANAPWEATPPILAILAESDSVISTPMCLEMLAELQANSDNVEVVVFAGADHGFDQRVRSPLSSLTFDQALRDRAAVLVDEFVPDVSQSKVAN